MAGIDSVCDVPRQAAVKSVSVLMVSDSFKGLIVTLKDALSDSLSPAEFEIFFKPRDFLKSYTSSDEVAKRVYSFEVSEGIQFSKI